jgi:hypothetical protein
MAGGRFSDGPIRTEAAPGPVIGELITRVSKLYSALRSGGSNLARAAADFPYLLRAVSYRQSVDLVYEPEAADADPEMVPETQNPVETALMALERLTAARDDIVDVAAEYGPAVTSAYRQLVSLLGQQDITAEFFAAVDERPDESTFVRLPPRHALAHAEALSSQQVIRTETTTLSGVLDELAGRKGTFKLLRPSTLTREETRAWDETVGRRVVIEGELTDEAETDIRRMNAWKSKVTAEVELTHMTAPKTTNAEEIEAKLLRIVYMQPRLED